MRQEFIPHDFGPDVNIDYLNLQCPWACHFEAVEGGHHAFKSIEDFYTWERQK